VEVISSAARLLGGILSCLQQQKIKSYKTLPWYLETVYLRAYLKDFEYPNQKPEIT